VSLNPDKLMRMFEELAEKLDISIVKDKGNFNGGMCTINDENYIVLDKGNFNGGMCTINDENYIVLNKSKPIEQRLKILANS